MTGLHKGTYVLYLLRNNDGGGLCTAQKIMDQQIARKIYLGARPTQLNSSNQSLALHTAYTVETGTNPSLDWKMVSPCTNQINQRQTWLAALCRKNCFFLVLCTFMDEREDQSVHCNGQKRLFIGTTNVTCNCKVVLKLLICRFHVYKMKPNEKRLSLSVLKKDVKNYYY